MTPQYENVGILQLYMLILNCQVFFIFLAYLLIKLKKF